MANKNVTEPNANGFEALESNLSKTEAWIEKNQKMLIIVLTVIIVLVLGFFGVKKYYIQPRNQEAKNQMFYAEKYFESDQFDKALNGDGNNLGFLDIINDYSMTKSANLAQYYAGISYLNLGDFNAAIKHLKKFNGKDNMVAPIALGGIGDAYLEIGDMASATKYYMKAANKSENSFTAPLYLMRAASVYEMNGDYAAALKAYNTIKYDYATSNEANGIEKYIEFAKAKMSK